MKRLISLLLCIVLFPALLGCQTEELLFPGTFYYRRTDAFYSGTDGVIAPEQRDLNGIEHDLGAILSLYCNGPASEGLENPLPPGAKILDWQADNEELHLHFTHALSQLSGVDLTVAAGCLARTFLPLSGASTLVLTAENTLLNNESALRISESDLFLRDGTSDRLQKEFTVYYAAPDNRYLIGYQVSVQPTSEGELPMQLLELLLNAPEEVGLHSALPQGTRILSARVADGLCTVDLSAEFETERFFSIGERCMSLLSIVNTLTGLEEVERVEFTVEGGLLIRYGSLSISEPLVRDERCIGPVRTGLGEQDATAYLCHSSENLLIPIPVRLPQNSTMSSEELLLRALLSDPGTNGIRSLIPAGTAPNFVTTYNGTCHVDLSDEFLSDPGNLPYAIRVITASLCALDGIERVKITVDGGIPPGFESNLFGTLSPNSNWFL